MEEAYIPVLIVGGGLAGLSTALFLSQHHIASLVVERHPGTTIHPKQVGLSIRAMEVFRSVGLEPAVRAAGAALMDNTGFIVTSTLAQGAWKRFPTSVNEDIARHVSPIAPSGGCPQHLLEPLLLEAVRSHGGTVCFEVELKTVEQDTNGITAVLFERATGQHKTIRAEYVVAADGAKSPLRHRLGIPFHEYGTFGHRMNIYFHADLSRFIQDQPFAACMITHPEARGALISLNNCDHWMFHADAFPEKGEIPSALAFSSWHSLLQKAIGDPHLVIDVKSVLPWEARAAVADRFLHNRIFLVGDAAHMMPPAGPLGASTGIIDAHNLAWKLALVLNHQARPSLLATYESERKPVAHFTVEQAILRWTNLPLVLAGEAGAAQRAQLGMAHELVMLLGYSYTSQAVIVPRLVLPSLEQIERDLDGAPGTRAPHLWISQQGQRISLLDLFHTHFVLLAGEDGEGWCQAAHKIASSRGLHLRAYRVGKRTADLIEEDQPWHALYGISSAGAVLVRPDGHVAWRQKGDDVAGDFEHELKQVLSTLLGWSNDRDENYRHPFSSC